MPSNSLIQPLFYYRRILLHPVYINRVHIRNKREYEGDNYSYSTTFLQKIWSEGALKALTLLPFPHPLMSYRVLFDCIHIICKGRGHGAGRGGSLSVIFPPSFRCPSCWLCPSALSRSSYMFHMKHYCISWDRTYVLHRCSIVWESVRCERMFDTT